MRKVFSNSIRVIVQINCFKVVYRDKAIDMVRYHMHSSTYLSQPSPIWFLLKEDLHSVSERGSSGLASGFLKYDLVFLHFKFTNVKSHLHYEDYGIHCFNSVFLR